MEESGLTHHGDYLDVRGVTLVIGRFFSETGLEVIWQG